MSKFLLMSWKPSTVNLTPGLQHWAAASNSKRRCCWHSLSLSARKMCTMPFSMSTPGAPPVQTSSAWRPLSCAMTRLLQSTPHFCGSQSWRGAYHTSVRHQLSSQSPRGDLPASWMTTGDICPIQVCSDYRRQPTRTLWSSPTTSADIQMMQSWQCSTESTNTSRDPVLMLDFVAFSSAFSTMHTDTSTGWQAVGSGSQPNLAWIFSFLMDRLQHVIVGTTQSDTKVTNTLAT